MSEIPRIDVGKLATELATDARVRRAKQEISKCREVVDEFYDKSRQVFNGTATWHNGSHTIQNGPPEELVGRFRMATANLERAEREVFDRQRPMLDEKFEAQRRAVEASWADTVSKMQALHVDESAVKKLKPRRVLYRCETADRSLTDTAVLEYWRARTWRPRLEERRPLPKLDVRKLLGLAG